jgi:putative restriction endonuclease
MASEHAWQHWLQRLYNLRRDKRGAYEPPHKPVLLLTVLDLFDRGILCHNQVPFSPELVERFELYFGVVRTTDEPPAIENPFYQLSGDGFWNVLTKSGNRSIYEPGNDSPPPSLRILRETYGQFDDGFWSAIVTFAKARRQLREALISRYFPAHRDELNALVGKQNSPPAALAEEPPGRAAAFRRTILEIYDHRCAACGIRVKLTEDLSLVEAAHLIPFNVSRDDKPDNGLALCPNHHWAMEHSLIAPGPDPDHPAGVWRVRPGLDDCIEGQKDLIALADQPVIPPNEEKFFPAVENLRWRERKLEEAGGKVGK